MPKLTAKLEGIPDAVRKTNTLGKILNRVGRKMMGEIGQFMVRSSKRNFSDERSPDGKRWKDLSERTKKEKGHSRKLFETGALNRAIQIISLDSDKVSVGISGTEIKKALTHQLGRDRIDDVTFNIPEHTRKAHTRQQAGKTVRVRQSTVRAHTRQGSLPEIPARSFLGFNKPRNDESKIRDIAVKHLQREVRKIA